MLGVGLGNQRTDLSIKLDFFSGQQRCEWFFFGETSLHPNNGKCQERQKWTNVGSHVWDGGIMEGTLLFLNRLLFLLLRLGREFGPPTEIQQSK